MQHLIEQKHLDLMAKIYDIPLQPETLQSVLNEFALAINANMSGIALFDPVYDSASFSSLSSNFGSEFSEIFRNAAPVNYKSPFINLKEHPNRELVNDLDMIKFDSLEEYSQRPIIQAFKEKYNVFRGAASRLSLNGAWLDILFVMFPVEHGAITAKEKIIAEFFLGHFEKAIELGRTFGIL